jgi:hypothetical protein
MSDYLDSNRGAMPPIAESSRFSPQYLAGTGATEATNTRAFSKDRMHILTVGAVPIRVLFSNVKGATDVVPTTGGAIIPANSSLSFLAIAGATYIYMQAADGTSAYTASVWQREP